VPTKKRKKHHPAVKAVGARLKALRLQKGLSQEALAHAARLERAYISGVERGQFNVSVSSLGYLADALDVPLSELFSF
jgi:transcriptional regulator with XRE-family HTH domain